MSKATRLALTGLVAALLMAAATASAVYTPPLGIPAPPFGIDETHMMYVGQTYDFGAGPVSYPDAGNGPYTHYIDNTDPNTTDTSNPYGTPAKPRETVPDNVTLPAGSVFEIHGGPYTYGGVTGGMHMTRWISGGTSTKPVFIRGADPNNRVLFDNMETRMRGTYLIVENIEYDHGYVYVITYGGDADGLNHHHSVRNCEMYGRPEGYGSVMGAGQGHYVVFYNNYVHDNGNMQADDENDMHGFTALVSSYKVWILNNHAHDNSGDSVQINSGGGVPTSVWANYIYIGGNEFHHDGENAINLKGCKNIVMSENHCYDYLPTNFLHSGSDGAAFVIQYQPINAWVINNRIHNACHGIRCNGAESCWIVNNLIYDMHHDPNSSYNPYTVWGLSSGVITWATPELHVIGNTMYDVDAGFLSPGGGAMAHHVSNNIIAELAEPSFHVGISGSGVCPNSELPYNCLYDSDDGVRIGWLGTTYTSLSSFEAAHPGKSTGCIDTDPMLVDPDNGNFSIADTSPAADAGTGQTYEDYYDDFDNMDGLDIGEDYDGNIRPQGVGYAMGAYEVAGTVGNAAPNVNAGSDDQIMLPNYATLDGTVSDDGRPASPGAVTTIWSKDSGPGTVTFGDTSAVDTTVGFSENGVYVLKLQASDGDLSNSDMVQITVDHVGPTVDAGSNDECTLPNGVTLDGTVSDDGYPLSPGSLTTTWSKSSGPGTVTFGDSSAVDTTAGFSTSGAYVLRLTANDGDKTAYDDVTITVNAAPGSNSPPTADAGSDDTITLPNYATLDGTVSDDGLPDPPASLTTTWSKDSGPGTVTFGDISAVDTTAGFSENGVYVLQLLADDGTLTDSDTVQITVNHLAPTADAGSDDECTLPSGVTLDGTVSDDGFPLSPGSVTTTWTKQSGPGTVTFGDSSAVDTTAGFSASGAYVLRLTANDGDKTAYDDVAITVNAEPGSNQPPTADAGSNDSITLPNYATLDGTVSDDGLPDPPASLTTTWSKDSGPGTVTFGDSAAVDTTAGFSEAGTYVLKLEADDGTAADADTVTISVSEAGTGSGPFQEEGGTVVMEAENYDDNDTRTDPTNAMWAEEADTTNYSGFVGSYMRSPGPALTNSTWANGCELTYDVDFQTAGTYECWMRRWAYDTQENSCFIGVDGVVVDDYFDNQNGGLNTTWYWMKLGPGGQQVYIATGSRTFSIRRRERNYRIDRLILTIDSGYTPSGTGPEESSRSGGPANTAPTANAGSNDTITLPNYATLDGTVSDDGLPDPPASLTTTWSKDSGPGTVTFGDSSAVDTTAGFSVEGTYVLKLEADDGTATDSDTVQIVVNPQNTAPTANAGSDDSITMPNYATLDGTVSDDGLPDPPASLTTTWSKDSGPGTVTFGDSSAVDTTAGFSEAGTYILKLAAYDGSLSDDDTVQIIVSEAGTGTGAFQEEGGTVVMEAENYDDNDTRTDPTSAMWAEEADTTNYSGFVGSYMRSPGPALTNSTWANGCELTYDVDFQTAGTYECWMRRWAYDTQENSCFIGVDGVVVDDYFDNMNGGLNTTWYWNKLGPGGQQVYIATGLRTFSIRRRERNYRIDRLILTIDSGYTPSGTGPPESSRAGGPANTAPTANAGSDDTITLPNYATLDGTVSDDGLPDPPASLTTTWSKDSGPGTVTFGDISAVDTTAGFSENGVYVLQLLADDGTLTDSDTVQITVNHLAPTVSAGNDDECTLPDGVTLDGTVSDDGFPLSPGSVTTTWTKQSGPGTVTFGDSSAVDTTAGFSEDGVYTLQLTASDGDKSGYNTVTITVHHVAPTADAGADDTITLPNYATLDGTVSDDGFPLSPGAVSGAWIKISGPGTVTFADAGAIDTTVGFSENGVYVLQLEASDGDMFDSDTVQITVNHVAPTVDAGSDDECTLPSGVTLDGTVSDDGFPLSPGAVTTTWTKQSGPGTVTFGDSSAVDTTAGFSEAGTYALRLTADDGDKTDYDDVTITVNPANSAPTANAGSDDSITLPNYATLDGTVSDDGLPDPPASLTTTWSKTSGPGTVTFGDSSAVDTTAGFSENGVYVLQLEASDGDLSDSDTVQITVDHVGPTANAGSDDSITLPSNATLDGTVSDDGFPLSPGSVTTTWTKQSGPGTVTFGDSSAVDTTAGFSEAGTYALRLTADDGDKTDYDDVTITVNPQNNAPTADAGSDDSCTIPNSVSLDGTVSDDGLPASPGSVTTAWTKQSGPGTVTFGDSSAVDTTAGFSENGVYVLQLEASDGDLSDSDTVQITVNHLAPTANAGSDDSITLPSNATLDGTVSDDGFPLSPGSVTTTWTKQSGPGTVTFGDSSAVDTTAGFSEAGTYALRLTADDGDKTDYDDVTITVNPANSAPTANAGSDDSITLPNYATLDGTVSDDGLPDPPASLTTTWSKDSGPGTVTFGDSSAVDTTAGFSEAGTYVLKLEASDGALSDDDTVQIIVNSGVFLFDDFDDNDLDDWTTLAGSLETFQYSTGYEVHATTVGSRMRADLDHTNLTDVVYISLKIRHTGVTTGLGWKYGYIWLVDDAGDGWGLYYALDQTGDGGLYLHTTDDDGATNTWIEDFSGTPGDPNGNDLKQIELVYDRVSDEVECFYEGASKGTLDVSSSYRNFTRVVVHLHHAYLGSYGQLDVDDVRIATTSVD